MNDGRYTFEVVNAEGVTSVWLSVAGLTLPITREQLLQILFGGGVQLTPATPAKKRAKKAPPEKKARHDSASRERTSKRMKARYAARYKQNLCAFCNRARLRGTRYCKEHTRGAAKAG